MKLFCLIGAASAASFLQNIDMNPEDANYNLKLGAFLKAMGVDVNTDAFFAEDNPTVSIRDIHFTKFGLGFDWVGVKERESSHGKFCIPREP